MSDDTPQIPQDAPAPVEDARVDAPPPEADPVAAAPLPGGAEEKPELMVAGAFAGAFLFAKLLRRIGGR